MNSCVRALTGLSLAATTAVALVIPASAAPSAPAATAAPAPASAAAAPGSSTLVDAWYASFLSHDTAQDLGSQYRVDQVDAQRFPLRTRSDQGWSLRLPERQPTPAEVAYWYPEEVDSDVSVGVLVATTPVLAARITPDDG